MLGLVRPPFGHTSVLSSWSMPPPVDRIRDLPSSSDLSFPQPVHESVSGTLLTTTGQDLSHLDDASRCDASGREGGVDSFLALDTFTVCVVCVCVWHNFAGSKRGTALTHS